MTKSRSPEFDLLELFAKHCDGTLSPTEAEQLASMLRDDAAARQAYIRYMDLHSALAWEASSAADLDQLIPTVPTDVSSAQQSLKTGSRREQIVAWFLGTRLRVALSVASCFLVALLIALAVAPAPLFDIARTRSGESGDRVVAAKITGSVDCVWQDTALPLGYGSVIYKGQQIELLGGTAEITFINGAVVTLRGPATYVIDSSTRSSLRSGELTALIPERGKGFTVQTPAAVVVDLGTEFGLIVSPAADETAPATEEVHVFRGVVELSLRHADAPVQRLTRNQAVRIHASGRIEQLAASLRQRFPKPIKENGDTTTADPLPPEEHPPVTGALTLWLSADGAIRTDEKGRVSVWEDMLTGDNDKAQNATQHIVQHRPELVPDSIGSRPALRFDGDDVLSLATPSSLGLLNSDYEIFIVARSASPAIQFLIAGGVEDFEVHLNGDAGARFIPAGYTQGKGASDADKPTRFSDGRAHLFSARVEADGSIGVVSVDGNASEDVVHGECRSVNNTSLRLGMRHDASFALQGEIAEVLIYRNGLTASERGSIQRYLTAKYGL